MNALFITGQFTYSSAETLYFGSAKVLVCFLIIGIYAYDISNFG